MRPSVVICGRPNVGKSTLFNILVKDAKALVHNRPGLTRDWITGTVADDAGFALVDTAGLEEGDDSNISTVAWKHSMAKVSEAELVLLMVDARSGLLPDDRHVASMLRKAVDLRRVVLVINKAENLTPATAMAEFHVLGFRQQVAVSATHAIGIGYLQDLLARHFATGPAGAVAATNEEPEKKIRLALIGRPNVGKSTLANKIVGLERMLVADKPGTTIDSVEIEFEHRGRAFALIDTPGMRRRAKESDNIEKLSSRYARIAAERADIIILLLDASQGVVHQDQLLASLTHGYGKATLLVANKSDLLKAHQRRQVQKEVRTQLPFMSHSPVMLISATRPRFRGSMVVERALACHDLACNRSSANKVTKVLRQTVGRNEPPRKQGKRPRLRFAHQAGTNPPLIIIHGRHVALIKSPYIRYLSGQFADQLGYGGAPVQIRFKETTGTPARTR